MTLGSEPCGATYSSPKWPTRVWPERPRDQQHGGIPPTWPASPPPIQLVEVVPPTTEPVEVVVVWTAEPQTRQVASPFTDTAIHQSAQPRWDLAAIEDALSGAVAEQQKTGNSELSLAVLKRTREILGLLPKWTEDDTYVIPTSDGGLCVDVGQRGQSAEAEISATGTIKLTVRRGQATVLASHVEARAQAGQAVTHFLAQLEKPAAPAAGATGEASIL